MSANGERKLSSGSESDEPSFEDPDDFVDDISTEELLSGFVLEKPSLDERMDTVIVVDNVPSVNPDRLDKLKKVIHKIMARFGEIVTEHYPTDQDGQTKGYIFLEYKTHLEATNAVKTAHGYRLDKSHVFSVTAFSDFEKYSDIKQWTVPERQEYVPQENLRSWLQNAECLDQFVVSYASGDKTAICSNALPEPTLVLERSHWTEGYLRWSPCGAYLATMHKQGIALWGGESFKRIERFAHLGVKFIDFSPCERYLVTFCPQVEKREDAVIIWDIWTGTKKRGFQCEDAAQWPIFKWSHSGKYFARQGIGLISVYETETFGLLDKKSILVKGISDILWSPVDDIISFWVPEDPQQPARVTIMEIPSRREIRFKTLFNISTCKMYWQQKGEYLCLKVDRYASKNKKTLANNLEIFSLKEKLIPVNQLDVKGTLAAFAWEPNGPRFVTVQGVAPMHIVSFYKVEAEGKITLLHTIDQKSCNVLSWSPQGQFLILAHPPTGSMEFCDTSDMCIMSSVEHYQMTDIEWDPTGRYVASSVSWWTQKTGDHGYFIWNFQGKLLTRRMLENFCQIMWRPRPPSLLTQDDLQAIRKDMKTYQRKFEMKDKMSQTKSSKELVERRRSMMKDFHDYRRQKSIESKKRMDELKKCREANKKGDVREDAFEEKLFEFLVNEEEPVLVE